MFKSLLRKEYKLEFMKQSFKGGYILVSLGLIELSTEYQGSIDYERISRTKKHIVLTGIKVDGEIMPDVCVKPQYGVGTVFFENVYGFDIGIHTDNSVDVDVHEETPNVEKAPSGTLSKMLGLDASGKVVKGDLIPNVEEAESGTPVSMLGLDEDGDVVKSSVPSSGIKLYEHDITITLNNETTYNYRLLCTYRNAITKDFISLYSNRLEGFHKGEATVLSMGVPFPNASTLYVSKVANNTIIVGDTEIENVLQLLGTTYSLSDIESISDTVTEL